MHVPDQPTPMPNCRFHQHILRAERELIRIGVVIQLTSPVGVVARPDFLRHPHMSLAGVPLWNDQDVELFHGTLAVHVPSILAGVDVTKGRHLRDFGRGFYTATNRVKAELWARELARFSPHDPAVIRFAVSRNDLAGLDGLFFIRGDSNAVDYWSFVQYCRMTAGDHNRAATNWYDIVAGPVVGTLKKQTVIPDADQISFHTRAGEIVLNNSPKDRIR